jgi:hypothetical protein
MIGLATGGSARSVSRPISVRTATTLVAIASERETDRSLCARSTIG